MSQLISQATQQHIDELIRKTWEKEEERKRQGPPGQETTKTTGITKCQEAAMSTKMTQGQETTKDVGSSQGQETTQTGKSAQE